MDGVEISNLNINCWREEGRRIVEAGRKASDNQWQIGDWWNAGEPYGERTKIAKELGLKPAVCRKLGHVAGVFDVLRRRNTLTFAHYQTVSSLDQAEQDRLLNWCLSPDGTIKSVAKLRAYIKQLHGIPAKSKKKNSEKDGDKEETRLPRRAVLTPALDKAREAIRPLVEAGLSINRAEWVQKLGVGEATIERADWAERGRLEGLQEKLDETVVDRATLSMSAQQKVDATIKREQARIAAEYAKRKAELDEEVRQRVLKENAEYLAYVNQKEAETDKKEEWYNYLINNHEPIFTVEGFMSVLRCLHSDSRGSVSAERLDEAFRLFNAKRRQLTGEK